MTLKNKGYSTQVSLLGRVDQTRIANSLVLNKMFYHRMISCKVLVITKNPKTQVMLRTVFKMKSPLNRKLFVPIMTQRMI